MSYMKNLYDALNGRFGVPELQLDPPEPKVVAYCSVCGDEVYENEGFRIVDGQIVHWNCCRVARDC